ncbi:hypothetical protein WICPIJ_003894 [Wickerhamomyces pijperi]|uniref:Putative tyrosine-protein phosphatase OCA1 n=1 Tax=Wickerhamomyces pijperi TaxID=599730 RepID=A0A9P8Q6A7_WICPI|nr:hypothetical protein WICPIJ_003894 [Wickerhamomyces pijperi]
MTSNQLSMTLDDMDDQPYTVDELEDAHYTKENAHVINITAPPKMRIVPPLNFCPVEQKLYRSGQPSKINFEFLRELKLNSIVWLASEDPIDEFIEFTNNENINLHFAGINPDGGDTNPWDGLNETSILQALSIMTDQSNYPILVCCGMGRHRTGTVIGCLRRLQGWNLASVSEEYRRFTGSRGGRILVELLIEAFDKNSVVVNPEIAPKWLTRS